MLCSSQDPIKVDMDEGCPGNVVDITVSRAEAASPLVGCSGSSDLLVLAPANGRSRGAKSTVPVCCLTLTWLRARVFDSRHSAALSQVCLQLSSVISAKCTAEIQEPEARTRRDHVSRPDLERSLISPLIFSSTSACEVAVSGVGVFTPGYRNLQPLMDHIAGIFRARNAVSLNTYPAQ